MASIRDVAKLAGVSPSTVSRVMNGTANVDEEKKRRVYEAIRETGFRPNELARALFRKASKIIGIIVPNIENPFFSELAHAVEEEAYRYGSRILLCSSNNNSEKEKSNIEMLSQMKADGIILVTHNSDTDSFAAGLEMPVIAVDRKAGSGNETAFIEADHFRGGYIAMEHMIQCGCRHIVCMRGPLKLTSGRRRFRGCEAAARDYGVQVQYIGTEYNFSDGLTAAEELLRLYPDVDGIIAANDIVALSVYKVLSRHGIRVPEQVQLIGFDDIALGSLTTPELTTVSQPLEKMGHLAVDVIQKVRNGEDYEKNIMLDVHLVPRETTRMKKEPDISGPVSARKKKETGE
ncbi:MAG: LacI family DNA-binding transcriptional regulator [Eubacteriales bacterium]|jgi:LacI family transcriptional regulator/LacI family sucrose operon transcriptional repressor